MAQITAHYRRVFQVRPYETETIELGLVDEVPETQLPPAKEPVRRAAKLAEMAKDLHVCLAEMGDQVLINRLVDAAKVEASRKGQPTAAQVSRPVGGDAPDPYAR